MRGKYRPHHILEVVLLFIALAGFSASNSKANENSKYLKAVREFADNVLKHGRDTYGPKHTPLFVDGLNIHTHEPVKWISPKGNVFTATETKEWILSNFASQQTLLRTLDGLSAITGDPKYRDAAIQAIKYAFENLRAPNGLFYWGHVAAYDAQADRIYSLKDTHTLKIHYPYYELMWQVDPDITKRLIEAFWSGHVMDWANLDFNRISVPYSDSLETPWKQEYQGGPTFFKSSGGGFFHTGTSLTYSGAMLYRFSGQKQPLVWSKRLMQRFVDTRHPNTGISAHQYNGPQRIFTNHNMAEHFRNPYTTVFPFHPFEGKRKGQLMYFGENWQPLPWISLLSTGHMLGEHGEEFTQWALEELTAWGKASYRKRDNAFVPILTDGTNIEGVVLEDECALGFKGDIAKTLFAGPEYFWAYTTAYRVTGDAFMWQMIRDICAGNEFGDIGENPGKTPELKIDTICSDVYGLLGFLNLYDKTHRNEFLRIARHIADNIVKTKFHKGFFVLSKEHIYARFGCLEPLALLHLAEVVDSGKSSIPQILPECPIFIPPYRYKQIGSDRWHIYRLTDSPEVPWSLQEAAHIGNINQVKALLESGTNVDSVDDSFRMTALQRAAMRGHKEIVEWLLAKGAYPNSHEGWPGGTALDYAAEKGHREVAELLIARGADVNAKRGYPAGDTPLHSAVRAGHKDIVELLIARGADVNAKNGSGDTTLHYAARSRDASKDIIELLIAKGADVNAKNNDGQTPLDIASSRNRSDIVELLLAKGATISSIHVAAQMGDLARVKAFLEEGTDVNAKDGRGYTPFHYSILYYKTDIASLLIERGADIHAKDQSGYTPLHWTVIMANKELTELILAKGADVNARGKAGETPLDFAIYGGKAIGQLLVEKGAEVSSLQSAAFIGDLAKLKTFLDEGVDVDAKNVAGVTALHAAASGGRKEVAEFLIVKGADINASVRNGQTPLHWASSGGSMEVVELLIDKGADVYAKDKRDRTPLSLAEQRGHKEIVELLRKHGSKE